MYHSAATGILPGLTEPLPRITHLPPPSFDVKVNFWGYWDRHRVPLIHVSLSIFNTSLPLNYYNMLCTHVDTCVLSRDLIDLGSKHVDTVCKQKVQITWFVIWFFPCDYYCILSTSRSILPVSRKMKSFLSVSLVLFVAVCTSALQR